jgi:hypothetical protein
MDDFMTWLFKICLFAVSVTLGLASGGAVPKDVVPQRWRLAVAVVLVALGVVLARIGFS